MVSHKVLIVKTGYSEVLDNDNSSKKVSLGDVLRTTPLLHYLKKRGDYVTWATDAYAIQILQGNKMIDRLVNLDFESSMKLLSESFDIVINLEKRQETCLFTDNIDAWSKFGFRLDKKTGEVKSYDRASEILDIGSNSELKKKNERPFQELLFEAIGAKWNGEEYVLGYKPSTKEKYDVGFNSIVGSKWPVKVWPPEFWDGFEEKLKSDGFTVSRQDKQGEIVLKSIPAYIEWINSCKTLISCDSLGLHLALALKKKVVGLFGPTPHREMHFYGRGKEVLPGSIPQCMPCFKPYCARGKNCMDDISIERVYETFKEVIQTNNR